MRSLHCIAWVSLSWQLLAAVRPAHHDGDEPAIAKNELDKRQMKQLKLRCLLVVVLGRLLMLSISIVFMILMVEVYDFQEGFRSQPRKDHEDAEGKPCCGCKVSSIFGFGRKCDGNPGRYGYETCGGDRAKSCEHSFKMAGDWGQLERTQARSPL